MTSSSRFRTSTTEEIALLLLLLPERATARVASFPRQKTAQDGRIEEGRPLHVRLGSLADISGRTRDVRFTPESGHAELQYRRPLSANSRHVHWYPTGSIMPPGHPGSVGADALMSSASVLVSPGTRTSPTVISVISRRDPSRWTAERDPQSLHRRPRRRHA